MSLVVAAHNNNEIVIAFDNLSRSTKTGSRQPASTVEKVKQIHPKLAYMMTGSFMSDKLQFMKEYANSIKPTAEFDTALWSLYRMAKRHMVVRPSDGFRLSLAGFNAGVPGFKCKTVRHGHEIVPEGSTDNYYLSGERDSVVLSEKHITASGILQKPSISEMTDILRAHPHLT